MCFANIVHILQGLAIFTAQKHEDDLCSLDRYSDIQSLLIKTINCTIVQVIIIIKW